MANVKMYGSFKKGKESNKGNKNFNSEPKQNYSKRGVGRIKK